MHVIPAKIRKYYVCLSLKYRVKITCETFRVQSSERPARDKKRPGQPWFKRLYQLQRVPAHANHYIYAYDCRILPGDFINDIFKTFKCAVILYCVDPPLLYLARERRYAQGVEKHVLGRAG